MSRLLSMLRPKTGATGEFSKLGLPTRVQQEPQQSEKETGRGGGGGCTWGTTGTGRKTKAASVPHTNFSEALDALQRPPACRASGGGRRRRAGGSRAQGRVAAGRSLIPPDKRGSLSRAHKAAAAGRGLGLGRPGRRGRAEVSGASSGPRRERGLLGTQASPAARRPRPVRSRAGTR